MTALSRRLFLSGLLGTTALALGACDFGGGAGGGAEDVSVSAEAANRPPTELHRGNGGEPATLDPHLSDNQLESWIIGDMLMGLYTEGPDAAPIFGAAESVETSADGRTWTFTLRDHTWSDGTPVTADDFVFAWRRILDPKTAAVYAKILYPFKNARAINAGEAAPESLGARAVDARTLELKLDEAAPYLPQLLCHQTAFPVPKHVVEEKGRDWARAGTYLANGPYVLSEWRPNDHIRLAKNPRFYDAAALKIETVYFYPTQDQSSALKRFRAGELDTNDNIPSAQLDWVRDNLGDALRMEPYLGSAYLTLNARRKPLDDIRVREALSLATDRETITGKVLRFGEPAAYSIVPPATSNYPATETLPFKETPFADRVARAKELLQQAGFGPDKRIALKFNTTSATDQKRVAAALQQMWREVFVDLEIVQSDVVIHYAVLKEHDFDVGTAGWIADFDDAKNFLFLFLSNNAEFNYGGFDSPEFDALYAQAAQTADAAARGKILAQAERLALDSHTSIPMRFPVTRNIVQPYVKGWITNKRDTNRTRWLSIEGPRRPAGRSV